MTHPIEHLSPEMRELIEAMARENPSPSDPTLMPPAEGRALVERGCERWNRDLPVVGEAIDIDFTASDGAAGKMRIIRPTTEPTATIFLLHGGGFAFCTPYANERFARLLANAAGMTVAMPFYRLAPEAPFPAGLDDTARALREVMADPKRFGLPNGPVLAAGESAGANLALSAIVREQRAGRRVPVAALLFYGVYTADFASPSYSRFAQAPLSNKERLQRYLDWYAPEPAMRRDPLMAPILLGDEELRRLPPLWLLAAEVDPLSDDTRLLHERLSALGRSDFLAIVPGVTHIFLQMSGYIEAARSWIERAAAAARELAEEAAAEG